MYLHSRWHNGGQPTRCFRCGESFDGEAHRGVSGRYYCSRDCREWACDEMKPEDVARLQ